MTDLLARLAAARDAVFAADRAWEAALTDAEAKRAYKAAVKAFRAVEREALDADLQVTCGRCDGEGHLNGFRHVQNGVCFRCAGNRAVSLQKFRFDAAADTRAKRRAKAEAANAAAEAFIAERGAAEAVAKIKACEALMTWSADGGWADAGAGHGAARAWHTLSGATVTVRQKIERFGDAEKGIDRIVRQINEAAAKIGVGAKYRRMDARYGGKCTICEGRIRKGEQIAYDGDAAHIECAVEQYTGQGELLSISELGYRARRERAEAERASAEAAEESYWESAAERRLAECDEAEYQAGIADGNRFIAEKAVYGEALAEHFAMQDEMFRHAHGLDDW